MTKIVALLLVASTATAAPWRHTSELVRGDAVQFARARLPAGEWQLLANHVDGELRTITFQQKHRGALVVGAHVGFVFGRDRLLAVHDHAQTVTAIPKPGQVIVKNIAVDVVETERATIYKRGNDIIAERPKIMFGSGTLKYNAAVRYPSSTRSDYPAPNATITVNAASATTSNTGAFSWTGTAAATVTPGLIGSYVRINNVAGTLATATLTAPNNDNAIWDASNDELADAQVSAYVYASKAKARARLINPAISTWLDSQLNVFVNVNSACNASSNGNDITFYRASTMCENTARLADIVFHEVGHSVHAQSAIPGMGDFETHLSEGLADFFAANMTEDPAVGRGFYLDDQPLRNIDPPGTDRVYPLDFDFDPHVSGLIIAGALWDLRKALIQQLGYTEGVARTEKIFTGVMQRADDISTSFTPALLADDDDADLTNGTPNFCAIQNAFGRHGLVPDYSTTTVSAPVVSGRRIALQVTTPSGAACPPPAVMRMSVTWRTGDGVPGAFDLAAGTDEWAAEFPEMPNGTVIFYSVEVQFDDGTIQVFPNNPADPSYQLMMGQGVAIWCESMDSDPLWEQFGTEWEWATLPSGPPSGDPRYAHTGNGALGIDLTRDATYRAGTTTYISTPAIDIRRFTRVHLQYWRWLTVEDANYDRAEVSANGEVVWRNATSVNGTLDHVDREWRFHDLDVTEKVGEAGTMQITWSLASDASKELGGWTLDDVCLVGFDAIGVCGDAILEEGEQCDDGNVDEGDGCDERCQYEPVSGGGCSSGNGAGWLLALALFFAAPFGAAARSTTYAPPSAALRGPASWTLPKPDLATSSAGARGACRRGRSRRACRNRPGGRADRRRSSA